jgi:antitoxin component of MazEF toxin-antitoxin module
MLIRKLVKIGSSLGIIIPKSILEILNWGDKDILRLEILTETEKGRVNKPNTGQKNSLLIRKGK